MSVSDSAFLFECEGDELVGIISSPVSGGSDLGVLIIVGGPQYRVGSHRQFVLLARHLAEEGVSCMRFDYRGMGDSAGDQRSFEHVDTDIQSAVNAFFDRAPWVKRVVLWGLCDGASAACFFLPQDPRVVGAVLLNPWVKTPAGEAKVYLKHYYLQRLADRAFWKKVLGGDVSIGRSISGLLNTMGAARQQLNSHGSSSAVVDLPTRMAVELTSSKKPFCVVLSGRDYVAREFESVVAAGGPWEGLKPAKQPVLIAESDHTFSSGEWRSMIEKLTGDWVRQL